MYSGFEFKDRYDIEDLLEIMRILRSEDGCPWDREQDHKSIRKDFLEEVYEVCEAIDREDSALLREELGDVLLQVVFHARIEEEKGNFTFADSVNDICCKLIVRHPHVFGDVQADNTDEVLKNWNDIKQKTKGQETYTQTLESVCTALPSLMRAQKLSQRAARAGYGESSEEAAEKALEESCRRCIADKSDESLGDMLFAAAELARLRGRDAEELLAQAGERYTEHFSAVEDLIRCEGKDMRSLNIDELNAYKQRAKINELRDHR